MPGTPLAKAEELATWFPGVPDTDPKLVEALTEASDKFRSAVRHAVSRETERVVLLDGLGRRSLRLPSINVVPATVTCTVDGQPVAVRASVTGLIRRVDRCAFPDDYSSVEVTYTAGFDDEEIPSDISAAVIDQARLLYAVKRGLQSMQVGGITVTQNAQEAVGVSQGWTDAVLRYRIQVGDRA